MHGRPESPAMTTRPGPSLPGPSLPGPTLGVVGGGQLGRMLAEAASPLGVDVAVLDPTPACPASRVADQVEGDFDDAEVIRELAHRADVLTYEIELADADVLEAVAEEFGVPVHPDPETLRTTQDKLREKQALRDAGIPVPAFDRVDDERDLQEAVKAHDGVMLKAREGGYDGRGNRPVESLDHVDPALREIGDRSLAETLVPFERELAVMGVRGADGETATFPVTETIHEEEILRKTVSPARTSEAVRERAREVATDVLATLSGRGVFGIELFETREGEVLVNEIAPRPHNSGHWTIEGATTSQFEQHVRAVLGWPLGSTDRVAPAVTANVLGDGDASRPARLGGVHDLLDHPHAHMHWYGKREVRPLRKMGHVTLTGREGRDRETLLADASGLVDGLSFA